MAVRAFLDRNRHPCCRIGAELGIGDRLRLGVALGFNTERAGVAAIRVVRAADKRAEPEQPRRGRAEEVRKQLESMSEEQLDQLLSKLVQKLVDEGYITTEPQAGGKGDAQSKVEVKVTDKSVDFLGFKTLKDLLGSLGHASFGAHDTRDLSTGVESSGATKLYEFGDTMNLDVGQTLFSAMRREGVKLPLNLEYEDLQIHQSEYQSSCATVLMLDCSHSMILYGEDRFTPAKKVALAMRLSPPAAI